MVNITTVVGLMFSGAALFLCGVLMGSWLMFKGKSSQPNESFIGPKPHGEVFNIPDLDGADEFPGSDEPSEAEKHVLKKTESFLKALSGGK